MKRRAYFMNHIVKIIKKRKPMMKKAYTRDFYYIGDVDVLEYSFPCDANGNIDTKDDCYDDWKKDYEYCLSHPDEYRDSGVTECYEHYTKPAIAKCSCGRITMLRDASMCRCGQWYNSLGQALEDPEY